MKISAVIVEDEDRGRKLLENLLLKYCPQIEVVALATNVAEAVAMVRNKQPDLVFLDIELPDGTGFKVLDLLQDSHFAVIFVTAYEHYAIKAIKRAAIDYLLKPIDIDELVSAVEKVPAKNLDNWPTQLSIVNPSHSRYQPMVALPTAEGLLFVKDEDIISCQSDSNYTHIVTTDKRKILVSRTLVDIEDMLSPELFCRVHHSYLVNLKHVRRYFKGKGGYLEMSDGSTIEVSLRKKQEFLARFA